MKFSEIDLHPQILAGLAAMDYTDLTPVQEQTFAIIQSGRDIIARAETGSGKTAACGVPLVQNVDPDIHAVQSLVLVPTRELALQYVGEIADIARKSEVKAFAVYGGFSMEIQKAKLEHGVHILVATPGRLIDMLYNSPLDLSQVKTFVLDEADEMLNMGFVEDVEFVLSCMRHEHQTLLFSATMPPEIKRLADKFLTNPDLIELNKTQVAPQNLTHIFRQISPHKRLKAIEEYLKDEQPVQTIVFCNSRHNSEKLYGHLNKKYKDVEIIHGGLEQSRRTSIFNRFKRKTIKIMIATDVAGRGLDFSHVTHVINFDFPNNLEYYTHRTGRTARMGRKGTALTYCNERDLHNVNKVIQINNLEPQWQGEAPDFASLSQRRPQGRTRPGQGHRRPRPKGRGGRKSN